MSRLEEVRLTKEPFQLYYRKTTADVPWLTHHAHQGLELLLIHEGNGELQAGHGGDCHSLVPGSLAVIPPFMHHRVLMPERSPFVRTIYKIEPLELEPFLHCYTGLSRFFHRLWKRRSILYLSASTCRESGLEPLFAQLHNRLSQAPDSQQEEHVLFCLQLLQLLRVRFDDRLAADPDDRSGGSHYVEEILKWVESNYAEPFRLESVAHNLHLSPSHVSRIFAKSTGSKLSDYVMRKRLEEARRQLAATRKPIERIGEAVGFASASNFCQAFKKHFDCSPLQYRKAVQRGRSSP